MPDTRRKLKVLKTLPAGHDGTLRLTRQYGPALVCVRYRTDSRQRHRFVTVELIVDTVPLKRRPPRAPKMVHLKLALGESDLRRLVCGAGAVLDPTTGLWVMPRQAAVALDLMDRAVSQ